MTQDLGEDLPPGTYIVLRESNIQKVMTFTGHSEEDLRRFLFRAATRGRDRVKLPLVPRSLTGG